MGLEPVGVAGQICVLADEPRTFDAFRIWCAILTMIFIACLILWFVWKKWGYFQWELDSAQQPLASHYDYAATLCRKLDNLDWLINTHPGELMEERVMSLTARIAVHNEYTQEQLSMMEDFIECLRYGLMESGGFVRNEVLTASQRNYMFVQERANFVAWNMERNRAENTDEAMEQQEDAEEEEAPTEDPPERGPEGMDTLMEAMRREQNDALAPELCYEASQIQGAIMLVLEASGGPTPTGMTSEVVTGIRHVFQKIWRRTRN